jgi:hypothetical protein
MQQSPQQMGEWKERGGWNTSASAHRFAEDVAILAVVVAELKLGDIRQIDGWIASSAGSI